MHWRKPKLQFRWNVLGSITSWVLLKNPLGVTDLMKENLSDIMPVLGSLLLLASIVGAIFFGLWVVINALQWCVMMWIRLANSKDFQFESLVPRMEECLGLLERYRNGESHLRPEALGQIRALSRELVKLEIDTPQVYLEESQFVTFDLRNARYVRAWVEYLHAMRGFARYFNLDGGLRFWDDYQQEISDVEKTLEADDQRAG